MIEISSHLVDAEPTPLGRLELYEYQASTGERGWEIRLDGAFLMASHGSHSERAMAGLAHARLADPHRPLEVLVGGLGAGHTLRAALDLPGVAAVTVAEIGACVVDWNRRFFAEVNGNAVDDPRVRVLNGDLADVLSCPDRSFDLALLDVDNGPGWLASPANAALYQRDGLTALRAALACGGVAAIWSPGSNQEVAAALAEVFGEVEALDTTAAARAKGEPGSTIYLVRRP